ncbi:MAG: GumC family protein, partial [Candidatus Binatia bacterium]
MNEHIRELSPYRLLREPRSGGSDPRFGTQPSAGADESLHLREYWRIVRKHRGLIVSLVLTAALGTAIVTFMMEPVYKAKAILQIEPQAPKVAPVQEIQQLNASSDEKYNYYDTQFEILESRALAARVIRTLGLDADERFLEDRRGLLPFSPLGWIGAVAALLTSPEPATDEPGDRESLGVPDKLAGRYQSWLSIEPVGKSRLVEVRFASRSPKLAAEIANAHVHGYIELAMAQRLAVAQRAKELLGDELEKAKSRALMAEAALNKFRREKGIISVDGDKADIVSERLYVLNKQLTEAQAERIRLESEYKLIESRDYESIPNMLDNPLISRLKEEAAKVEIERAELENQFFPGYPKLQRAIVREKQAKARLQAEIRKAAQGIESAFLAAKGREASLKKELNDQQHAALAQKDLGAEYDALRREADTARSLSAALLQRLADVDVTREVSVSNISVFDEAEIPTYPSSPRKLFSVTVALIVSAALGIALSFLLENLDNTLKTPE